jgi:hypothetical protein
MRGGMRCCIKVDAYRLRGITRQALIKVLLFEAVGVDVIKVRSIENSKT